MSDCCAPKDFAAKSPTEAAAGAIYDQTQSYALVFTGITISLLISTATTALLIKPWARIGTTARTLSARQFQLKRILIADE